MNEHRGEWTEEGTTPSSKTGARQSGLTRDEFFRAVEAGELQYRMQAIHGNPFLRSSVGRWKPSSRRCTAGSGSRPARGIMFSVHFADCCCAKCS